MVAFLPTALLLRLVRTLALPVPNPARGERDWVELDCDGSAYENPRKMILGCIPSTFSPHRFQRSLLYVKMRTMNVTNVRVIRGIGESMPFGDGSFDLVVANNGRDNVRDPQRVLRECHRICRPHAQMVVTASYDEGADP